MHRRKKEMYWNAFLVDVRTKAKIDVATGKGSTEFEMRRRYGDMVDIASSGNVL
jgi:hypothetical protein